MGNVAFFTSIIIIAFGILQIILFFKVWGMTNDVRKIKNILELNIKQQQDTLNHNPNIDPSFSVGEVVIYKKTQEKFIIKRRVTEDLFECSSLDTNTSYTLNRNELQK